RLIETRRYRRASPLRFTTSEPSERLLRTSSSTGFGGGALVCGRRNRYQPPPPSAASRTSPARTGTRRRRGLVGSAGASGISVASTTSLICAYLFRLTSSSSI